MWHLSRRRGRAAGGWVIRAALLGAVLATGPRARATDSAGWIGGNGLWSNPNNWNCVVGGIPNQHVVPGPGFDVSLVPDVEVTLDVDASVLDVVGYSTTTLTINPGKTLNAPAVAGVEVGFLYVGSAASGGSTVTAGIIGAQNRLEAHNSTLTAPNIVSSTSAFVEGSTLSTLSATGYIHISNSVVNGIATPPAFSGLTVTSTLLFSDVTSSFVNASVLVDQGASLVVDQGSTLSTPTGVITYSLLINTGTMTVQGGSKLNISQAAVQMGAGGAGNLVIDGAGSTMNLNGVGITMTGVTNSTLTVQNGGAVKGNGTSEVVVAPFAALGSSGGTTQVNVLSGGTMAVSDVLVSGIGGAGGGVTVSDANSTLTASGTLRLTGGTVDIRSLAAGTANFVDVQQGQLTVESNGTLSSPGPVLIGFNGNASLTVQTGGHVSSDQGVIAHQAGSTGHATVNGTGSQWQASSGLTVGMIGTGTLDVTAEGEVDSGAAVVADQAGSSGKATVGGTGSAWHISGALTVGNQSGSNGELTVQSQGLLETKNAGAVIANAPNTLGSATISSGGKWTIAQDLKVGNQGTGQLQIGGINTEVDDLSATIAALAGSNGAVSVQIGGVWKTTNGLTIADEGSGQLGIDLGARASAGAAVDVAKSGGSIGSLTVDGTFNIGGDLSVGKRGAGSMTVENGGAVAAAGGHVGEVAGSTGVASVTGSIGGGQTASSWSLAGTLAVGEGGTGSLTVSAAGTVSSQGGSIGDQLAAVGTMVVTDAGSTWENTGALTVGSTGTGELSIVQGGAVTSASAAVGAQAGADGTMTISDPGSQFTTAGTLTIGAGGGTGQGIVKVMSGGAITANTVIVRSQGSLGGNGGTISAMVINAGGVVRPGDAPGVLHINGDYLQNAGTLLFEIDGTQPGQFDQLVVSGQTTLSGGRIELDFAGGFVPKVGDEFNLIQAGGLSNAGIGLDVFGLPPNLGYSASFGPTGLGVTVVAVPEPGAALLLGAGLAALLRRRGGSKHGTTDFFRRSPA